MTQSFDSYRRAARIVQINGKRFVAGGVLWQPLSSTAGAKEEVVAFAQSDNMNLATIYSGVTMQAGFIEVPQPNVRQFAGAYALAPILADHFADQAQSWLGVFDLEDGNSILIAVSNGSILPGSDFVGTPDEIASEIEMIYHNGEWEVCFATNPLHRATIEGRGFVGAINSIKLDEVLTRKKYARSYRFFEIRSGIHPRVLMAGIAVIVIGMVAFGGHWYLKNKRLADEAEQSQLAALQNLLRRDARKEELLEKVAQAAAQPPWYQHAPAQAVVVNCHQGFNRLPMDIAAWSFSKVVCKNERLTATYQRRSGSTMEAFHERAVALQESDRINQFSVLPDQATVVIELPELTPRGEQDAAPMDEWTRQWLSLFQSLSMNTQLDYVEPRAPGPISQEAVDLLGVAAATPQGPWWETYAWSFSTTTLSPLEVLAGQSGDGFTVSEVELSRNDENLLSWSIKGEVYVKP